LGRSFEETGTMPPEEWIATFGPFDDEEEPMRYDLIPATVALRENRPYHGKFRICAADGHHQDIAASAIPIVGVEGSSGAIVIFWPVTDGQNSERSPSERGDEAKAASRGEESETA
jgi:PAS domain-containing protein